MKKCLFKFKISFLFLSASLFMIMFSLLGFDYKGATNS